MVLQMLTASDTRKLSDARTNIRAQFLTRLYGKQFKYWNERLIKLSNRNAIAHGRPRKIGSDYKNLYHLFHNGQIWKPETLDPMDRSDKLACLPVHPSFPQYEKEADIVCRELEELIDEKYEANRFIIGLITFPMTTWRFKEIIGDTLYAATQLTFTQYERLIHNKVNEASTAALDTFVLEHSYIEALLKERLLTNLITMDATQQS